MVGQCRAGPPGGPGTKRLSKRTHCGEPVQDILWHDEWKWFIHGYVLEKYQVPNVVIQIWVFIEMALKGCQKRQPSEAGSCSLFLTCFYDPNHTALKNLNLLWNCSYWIKTDTNEFEYESCNFWIFTGQEQTMCTNWNNQHSDSGSGADDVY